MKSAIRLMRANIKHGKGAFKGIIFLMTILVFTFSGTVSNDDDLRRALNNNVKNGMISDVTIIVPNDLLTDDMLTELDEISSVKSYNIEKDLNYCKKPEFDGEEKDVGLAFRRHYDDVRVFNDDYNGYVEDNTLAQGEVYLPYKLEAMAFCKKGTKIKLTTTDGDDIELTVKGFYEDPLMGPTTMSDNRAVISSEDFDRIADEDLDHMDQSGVSFTMHDMVGITSNDIRPEDLKKELGSTRLMSVADWALTKQQVMDCFEMYSNTGTSGMIGFTVLLVSVVMIVMYNSISSSIEMDRVDLGILKSQGVSTSVLRAAYIMQYTLALAIGSVLGILITVPVDHVLIHMWMRLTGILTDTKVSFLKCALLCVCIMLICLVFIFFATAKLNRISPVKAISGSKSDVHFESRLNTPIKQKALSLTIALRQLNSRRKSYIGTMLIVALLCYFLSSILLLTQNLDPENLFGSSDAQINLKNTGIFKLEDADAVEEYVRKTDENAVISATCHRRMLVDGESTLIGAYRLKEDYSKPLEGRLPEYDNEIMITKIISELTGKEIGDKVKVRFKDTEEEFVVTGYYQSVYEFGMSALVTREGIEKFDFTQLSSASLTLSDDTDVDAVINDLNAEFGDKLEASEYKESVLLTTYKKIVFILMDSVTYAMYTIIIIFAIVVVNMACKRAFTRERTDIGVFKATGFTINDLRGQFALRFTLVAMFGAVIGSLMSIAFSRKMIAIMLRAVGMTDFMSDFKVSVFLLPAISVCISFFVFSFITSGKVKKVEVRELITE